MGRWGLTVDVDAFVDDGENSVATPGFGSFDGGGEFAALEPAEEEAPAAVGEGEVVAFVAPASGLF